MSFDELPGSRGFGQGAPQQARAGTATDPGPPPALEPPAAPPPLGDYQLVSGSTFDRYTQILNQELAELEGWALANHSDSTRDKLAFWSLKGPAIVCSVCTAVFEALGWSVPVMVVGIVTGVCVAIDGALPRGQLHNVHVRAVHELRALQYEVRNAFQQAEFRGDLQQVFPDILQHIADRRKAITGYLVVAEAALGLKSHGDAGR